MSKNHDVDNQQYDRELRDKLKARLGKKVTDDWFAQFELNIDGTHVHLLFPDVFMKDWINMHYIDQLYACLQEMIGTECHICLDIMNEKSLQEKTIGNQSTGQTSAFAQTKCTFSNFIVGKTNEMAYTAATKICDMVIHNQQLTMNPLFIYGEPGVGKSHLLSSISNKIREARSDLLITHMTAEQFICEFIKALRINRDTLSFKEGLRNSKILLIDDVHFLIGKDSTQEEFFHTFNYLRENNCQIVLSSDKPSHKLAGLEERLKSRLGWGLSVEIHQPNYELRLAILQYKAEKSQLRIDDQALSFLASNLSGNLRDLEGAWNRLYNYAQWLNQDVGVLLIKQVLGEILFKQEKNVTIERIKQCVSDMLGISAQELQATGRKQDVVRARHIGIFLSREMTDSSLMQIASAFGGRDHTAILYAINKIKKDMQTDVQLSQDIEKIQLELM